MEGLILIKIGKKLQNRVSHIKMFRIQNCSPIDNNIILQLNQQSLFNI